MNDYVPLYWATHTPMQYVNTHGNTKIMEQNEIVFFEMNSKEILQIPGIWTSNGNCACSETTITEGTGAIAEIDWYVINSRKCFSKEYKRAKMAEVLVPDHIPSTYFQRIVTYDYDAQMSFIQLCIEQVCKIKESGNTFSGFSQDLQSMIVCDPSLYF